MMLALIAVLAQASVSADSGQPPRLLNSESVITTADYPPAARRYDQEGVSQIRLEIDEKGRVSNCGIATSSGFASLDEASCRLFRSRAKFAPAYDVSKRPISSSVQLNVRWSFPSEPLWPVTSWLSRTEVIITGGGHVRSCKVLQAGPIEQREAGCEFFSNRAGQAFLLTARKGGGFKDRTVVFDTQFIASDDAEVPVHGDNPGEELVSRNVSALIISPNGQVASCRMIEQKGLKDLRVDLCDHYFEGPFQAQLGDDGKPASRAAKAVMAIYLRL